MLRFKLQINRNDATERCWMTLPEHLSTVSTLKRHLVEVLDLDLQSSDVSLEMDNFKLLDKLNVHGLVRDGDLVIMNVGQACDAQRSLKRTFSQRHGTDEILAQDSSSESSESADSSSDSESSPSDSESSESSDSEEAPEEKPMITKPPLSLATHKKKQMKKLLNVPPCHVRFDKAPLQQEPPAESEPVVITSQVRLFDSEEIMAKNMSEHVPRRPFVPVQQVKDTVIDEVVPQAIAELQTMMTDEMSKEKPADEHVSEESDASEQPTTSKTKKRNRRRRRKSQKPAVVNETPIPAIVPASPARPEQLPLLNSEPKPNMKIAYKTLTLVNFTPIVSDFHTARVTSYDPATQSLSLDVLQAPPMESLDEADVMDDLDVERLPGTLTQGPVTLNYTDLIDVRLCP